MKIYWLELAEKNLDEIFNYFAEYSLSTALSVMSEISHHVSILINHPEAGQAVHILSDFSRPFRSLVVYRGRYRVIYYNEGDTVYIYAIVDCRQNPEVLERLLFC